MRGGITYFFMCAVSAMDAASPCIDSSYTETIDLIELYFKNFEILSKSEKWEEIISQGAAALQAAKKAGRSHDEAKICAQLTSTSFYLGDYDQALFYANRCHELAEKFVDPSLFIRALYLESAVYRALASKSDEEQAFYLRAVEIGEEAACLYAKKNVHNTNLQGKIYFNLGAAHADNPQGDLAKAMHCYSLALECFKSGQATDDIIRTSIRLGKVYLLQKNYDLAQGILDEVRSLISSERIAMQADYLEAQIKLALHDKENASKIALKGLARAQALGAKEDESRLLLLLAQIHLL